MRQMIYYKMETFDPDPFPNVDYIIRLNVLGMALYGNYLQQFNIQTIFHLTYDSFIFGSQL